MGSGSSGMRIPDRLGAKSWLVSQRGCEVALSDYEKRVLAEMEQHLRQQDPELADTMAASLPEPVVAEEPVRSKPLSPRRIALGSIMAAVGLAVLLVGVGMSATWLTILLGAAGFALMVGGILYALTPSSKNGSGSVESQKKTGGPSSSGPAGPARPTREERDAKRRERWENRGR